MNIMPAAEISVHGLRLFGAHIMAVALRTWRATMATEKRSRLGILGIQGPWPIVYTVLTVRFGFSAIV